MLPCRGPNAGSDIAARGSAHREPKSRKTADAAKSRDEVYILHPLGLRNSANLVQRTAAREDGLIPVDKAQEARAPLRPALNALELTQPLPGNLCQRASIKRKLEGTGNKTRLYQGPGDRVGPALGHKCVSVDENHDISRSSSQTSLKLPRSSGGARYDTGPVGARKICRRVMASPINDHHIQLDLQRACPTEDGIKRRRDGIGLIEGRDHDRDLHGRTIAGTGPRLCPLLRSPAAASRGRGTCLSLAAGPALRYPSTPSHP